jgi:uncharacterized RDD family membrane protein YckC/Tfp pilus assembly protein PilE
MSAPAKSPWNPPKAPLVAESYDAPIYAGFWRRWAAAVIDGILYYIVAIAIGLALGDGLGSTALAIAAAWLYHALMQSSSRQATLGKMALGVKVTSVEGERISFLRATGRYFATILSSLLLMIGYLMAAFTQRKQALHDMIAGTLVVRADASPEEVQSGSGTMKISGVVIAFGVLLAFVPVLGILAAIAIPAYGDYTVRAKMTESVATASAAKVSVQEYFQANRKLPASLAEAGFTFQPTQNVKSVQAMLGSERVVIIVHPAMTEARGGAVMLKAPADQLAPWTCSTDLIPHKYLPASCRN